MFYEVDKIKKVMEDLQMSESKLIVVLLNKKINSWIFMGDSLKLNNP